MSTSVPTPYGQLITDPAWGRFQIREVESRVYVTDDSGERFGQALGGVGVDRIARAAMIAAALATYDTLQRHDRTDLETVFSTLSTRTDELTEMIARVRSLEWQIAELGAYLGACHMTIERLKAQYPDAQAWQLDPRDRP